MWRSSAKVKESGARARFVLLLSSLFWDSLNFYWFLSCMILAWWLKNGFDAFVVHYPPGVANDAVATQARLTTPPRVQEGVRSSHQEQHGHEEQCWKSGSECEEKAEKVTAPTKGANGGFFRMLKQQEKGSEIRVLWPRNFLIIRFCSVCWSVLNTVAQFYDLCASLLKRYTIAIVSGYSWNGAGFSKQFTGSWSTIARL